jgi:hypothetical protein
MHVYGREWWQVYTHSAAVAAAAAAAFYSCLPLAVFSSFLPVFFNKTGLMCLVFLRPV